MADRPTVLILSYSHLASDPRVNRQIRFLKDAYSVVCAGLGDPGLEDVAFLPLLGPQPCKRHTAWFNLALLLSGRYDRYYWRQPWVMDALGRLSAVRPRAVIANDADTLPLGLEVGGTAPVIFDAHEYSPLEYAERFEFRLLYQGYNTHICRKYIPRTAAVTTVCETIANRYRQEFGARPTLILNVPDYEPLAPRLAERDGRAIRLIHHGNAGPARKLELTIDLMDHLDERFELTFMLASPDLDYVDWLKRRAAGKARIAFRDPVPMRALAQVSNEYDLGVFLLPPVNYNYQYALPNKFFEFIQGRIGVAIGPSPEMAGLVERYDLGVVASDFTPQALAARLNALTWDDVKRYKLNADRVARQFSADATRQTLLALVAQVLQ
jgi:hypothetical protein